MAEHCTSIAKVMSSNPVQVGVSLPTPSPTEQERTLGTRLLLPPPPPLPSSLTSGGGGGTEVFLPDCNFQLLGHCTGIAEVTGSNSVTPYVHHEICLLRNLKEETGWKLRVPDAATTSTLLPRVLDFNLHTFSRLISLRFFLFVRLSLVACKTFSIVCIAMFTCSPRVKGFVVIFVRFILS